MKYCNKCEDLLPFTAFCKKSSEKDGLNRTCRACASIYKKRYHEDNKVKLNADRAAYYRANQDLEMERHKRYRQEHAESRAEICAKWRERCAEHVKSYKESNRAAISLKSAEYYQRKKPVRNEQYRTRYGSDQMFALRVSVRARTRMAIRSVGGSKNASIVSILGCSIEKLKRHLEGRFKPGMTWENRGEWEIDHIIPLACAVTKEELLELCKYTNLQPLWASENRSKGARIPQAAESETLNVPAYL